MCPAPGTVPGEPTCCECQAKFGGFLPVPRVRAALPYWVPLSLRPRKQIQKMVRFYIPKSSEACPCSCHRFGGRLPMPRDQAVMPYWVPQILRPHRKAVKRQQSCKGIQEPFSGGCCCLDPASSSPYPASCCRHPGRLWRAAPCLSVFSEPDPALGVEVVHEVVPGITVS
ncbi:uncharacterized protein C16orf95 homolog isoform X3 [Meles meles]|uniref:uncharacterized protein C16orf95 homolog isoform X3 n=1 Tax=Meles meles TaxID=9662 RepID=UPI001E69B923|nr:uncharacterized protein C16orf95 homolog isoform X3 [Meles meles]